jgi:DNA-binding GntR family transcriptional regulator
MTVTTRNWGAQLLVTISPNRGALVAALDARAARDLDEIRELLEVAGVHRAASPAYTELSDAGPESSRH